MSHSISRRGWTANYNSDMSGDVLFVGPDGQRATAPASVVLGVVAAYVASERVSEIEQMDDLEILTGKPDPIVAYFDSPS